VTANRIILQLKLRVHRLHQSV